MSNGEPETSDEQPLDQLDPEVRDMIPDGWDYEDIVELYYKYDDIYPVADELGVSRSKGAFLLRKLGFVDHLKRPQESDVS